ncbi:hypothetical protein [Paenibacillus sp. FSL H7-0714]
MSDRRYITTGTLLKIEIQNGAIELFIQSFEDETLEQSLSIFVDTGI